MTLHSVTDGLGCRESPKADKLPEPIEKPT